MNNEYRVVGWNGSQFQEVFVASYDMSGAIMQSGMMANQIVKVELIGTQNKMDYRPEVG